MTVSASDTARALGSGDVEVLGTPRLIALLEEACCRAIAPDLGESQTTVGMKVQVDHLQPSPIGTAVTAEAVLQKVEARRLAFTVSASDDRGLIAAGKVVRVVVDRDRFLGKSST